MKQFLYVYKDGGTDVLWIGALKTLLTGHESDARTRETLTGVAPGSLGSTEWAQVLVRLDTMRVGEMLTVLGSIVVRLHNVPRQKKAGRKPNGSKP